MGKISNYSQDANVTATDKLLGSDSGGATKNFSVESLSDYFAANTGVHKHTQNSAAAAWTIVHNLDLADFLPSVTIKMSGGAVYPNIQGLGMVTYVDKDTLRVNFLGAHSGYAYLRK